MKHIIKIMIFAGVGAMLCNACANDKGDKFNYLLDEFADLKVMRYKVPGWENLSLKQKEYAYHLSEAAKWGRDIIWDQNCALNLELRKAIEAILNNYEGDKTSEDYAAFLIYAKRVFFIFITIPPIKNIYLYYNIIIIIGAFFIPILKALL